METTSATNGHAVPWTKGPLLRQKPPLKLRRSGLSGFGCKLNHGNGEVALFNLVIDSKLRECDLVRVCVHHVVPGSHVAARAIVMQK